MKRATAIKHTAPAKRPAPVKRAATLKRAVPVKRARLGRMDTQSSEDGPTFTIQEYVRLEEESNLKHEYFRGQIRMMSGGTLEHSRLAAYLMMQLGLQLKSSKCYVFSGDARVHVVPVELITYPDVTICCGKPHDGAAGDPNAMVNPTVVIEVLSVSTQRYDRTKKFERYKLLDSLREYVLVSQWENTIEVFRRLDDGWSAADVYAAGQRAKLTSVGCEIDVDELYERRLNC